MKPAVPTEIIAHRGASRDAPENTLAAARLAWEQGADALECDIHLTRDGEIVVIHDGDLRRLTGVRGVVSQSTLSELRALDAGKWKHRRHTGEGIPTLDEWLATGNGRFFIEIKCGAGVIPELKAALARSGKAPGQILLIAFDRKLLHAAKAVMPEYAACWILAYRRHKGVPTRIEEAIRECREAGLDGLDLSRHWPINAALVEKVHLSQLLLYVWTVDLAITARRLVKAGVDGITTNRPGWMREKLEKA